MPPELNFRCFARQAPNEAAMRFHNYDKKYQKLRFQKLSIQKKGKKRLKTEKSDNNTTTITGLRDDE